MHKRAMKIKKLPLMTESADVRHLIEAEHMFSLFIYFYNFHGVTFLILQPTLRSTVINIKTFTSFFSGDFSIKHVAVMDVTPVMMGIMATIAAALLLIAVLVAVVIKRLTSGT